MYSNNQSEIERRVFTSFLLDGSLEAFAGIFLLITGLAILLSRYSFGDLPSGLIALAIVLVLIAVVFLIRKFVVIPRLGSVKFLPQRRRKLSKLIIIPSAVLIAGIIISLVFLDNPDNKQVVLAQLPIFISPLVLFSVAAYFLDMKRLYLYSVLIAVILPLGKYLETIIVSPSVLPVLTLVAAGIFFIVSICLFISFLRKSFIRV